MWTCVRCAAGRKQTAEVCTSPKETAEETLERQGLTGG